MATENSWSSVNQIVPAAVSLVLARAGWNVAGGFTHDRFLAPQSVQDDWLRATGTCLDSSVCYEWHEALTIMNTIAVARAARPAQD